MKKITVTKKTTAKVVGGLAKYNGLSCQKFCILC
jgi:hypothetical protein